MSSRDKAKKWMKFCKHLREAIIDEQKAVPDYQKLIKEGNSIDLKLGALGFPEIITEIIEDEKRHKRDLIPLFDRVCPRMAVHRKGVK